MDLHVDLLTRAHDVSEGRHYPVMFRSDSATIGELKLPNTAQANSDAERGSVTRSDTERYSEMRYHTWYRGMQAKCTHGQNQEIRIRARLDTRLAVSA